jgi:predicted helicase
LKGRETYLRDLHMGGIIINTHLKRKWHENSLCANNDIVTVLFFISRIESFSSVELLGSAAREFVPFKNI